MNEVDLYISGFPPQIQDILSRIRKIIKEAAPGVYEGLSYGMPSYRTHNKVLVYFAAFKKHIGFYATPSGHGEFQKELSMYKQGKGSVQFPLDKHIPYELIRQMVEYRVWENDTKYGKKDHSQIQKRNK